MAKKKFHDEELPHELFTTTRQKTKIKNTFANNTSTDIKLSKAQLSKIIQWGRFLFDLLGKLTGPMMKVYVPLGIFFLVPLTTMASASAIDGVIQKKCLKKML